MPTDKLRSERRWWIAGGLIVAAIVLLLALLVASETPHTETALAAGETEVLRARVVQVLEQGVATGDGIEQQGCSIP